MSTSPGSYKGIAITGGTDAQVASQIAAIDAKPVSTPTIPTTLNSTNTASNSAVTLPSVPVNNTNYQGYIAGGTATIGANTPALTGTTPNGTVVNTQTGAVVTPAPQTAPSALDTFKSYISNLVKPPSASDQYNTDYNASGIDQKQADFNTKNQALLDAQSKFTGINAQLQGLNAESTAVPIQQQQDATGRGITEAGLAPHTADELRKIALRAIPLQTQALVAQAEVASAQGNAQLSQSILQQAQDHLDKVFQIHQADAQAQYQYQNNLIDKIYEFASKQEQAKLDEKKLKLQQDFTTKQNLLNGAQELAKTAITNGQGTLAGKILALNPDSPTYQTDIAKLGGQITKAPTSNDSAPTVKSINGVDMQWDPSTKTWKTIDGGTTSKGAQVLATSKSNVDAITSVLTSPGLEGSVGTNFLSRTPQGILGTLGAIVSGVGIPSVESGIISNATGAKQDFLAGVQQLTSQLTLDSLIRAKAQGATFGALSEGELGILQSSGTKLSKWAITDNGKPDGKVIGYNVNEKDFKAELDKINNLAKLDYIVKGGDPTDVGAKIMPDGSVWTLNSSGSLTQIK